MVKRGLNLPKKRSFKGPANLFKRVLAFILDLFIINLLIYPLASIVRKIVPETTSYMEAYTLLLNNPQYVNILTNISLLIAIIAILYFSILEFKLKQTVGKMVANIYVVSENKELRLWQCFVRNLFLLPFIPFILLWIIDPIYAIFTKENKRFSDVIAKTKVIEYYSM
jgi:uncharacterized RDD family membrane protein YckC